MTYIFVSAPRPYEIAAGNQRCDHIGCQVISYESPEAKHTIWSCDRCHGIIRQDMKHHLGRKGGWTKPVAVVPVGLEGVKTPNGRQWKMPDATPLKERRKWLWL